MIIKLMDIAPILICLVVYASVIVGTLCLVASGELADEARAEALDEQSSERMDA